MTSFPYALQILITVSAIWSVPLLILVVTALFIATEVKLLEQAYYTLTMGLGTDLAEQ